MGNEKYHWRDGLCFTRQPNGDVLIEKHQPGNLAPAQHIITGKMPAVEATVLIPASEWPDICAAMSLDGQGMFSQPEWAPEGIDMVKDYNMVAKVFRKLHSTPFEVCRVYSVCNYGSEEQEP